MEQVVIFGGGTFSYVRAHLALAPPAFGETARTLCGLASFAMPDRVVRPVLTKMADHDSTIITNDDLRGVVKLFVDEPSTRVIIMNAAVIDFNGTITGGPLEGQTKTKSGKYAPRLRTRDGLHTMTLSPSEKILPMIREKRKDIFLVSFKTTVNYTPDQQYQAGLSLLKESSSNLVLANDLKTRMNMIIVPEESQYGQTTNRYEALKTLVDMIALRSYLTYTRSTVVPGDPVPWDSEILPTSLREVVNFCVENGAYKPGPTGATAGHFAVKINDGTNRSFLTSIRGSNFNDITKVGMVRVVTSGPDLVTAYGAKPSVGGQSQRIVFTEHPDCDCIVHFHCPLRIGSQVPILNQQPYECGSHECGQNTSRGLREFKLGDGHTLKACYLDWHGPNIVFNQKTPAKLVCDFITANFNLAAKTDLVAITE